MAAAPAMAQSGAAGPDEGAGPLRLTLEEAISLALTKSRSAVRARLTREEQKLSLEAAEERYRPRASVGASVSDGSGREPNARVSFGPSLRVPTGGTFALSWSQLIDGPGDESSSTSLTFTQPLLRGFGPAIDMAPLRIARMNERINLRSFRDRVSQLVVSVIRAYRGVLSARRRVDIDRAALARAERQLEIDRALVQAGTMAEREVLQSESNVANRRLAVSGSAEALAAAKEALGDLLDVEAASRMELMEEPSHEPSRPDLERSLATAFERRTDYLSAQLTIEKAKIAVEGARNDLLWDLSLRADASRRSGAGKTDYGGALNLTVPLWNKSPKRALVTAENGLRRARMDLAETRERIRLAVGAAVRGVEVGLRRIELARAARRLTEEKLRIERQKLREGLSSSFQLGRFEDDLVRAQNGEIDALLAYRNALMSLDEAIGRTLDSWKITLEQVAP